MTFIRPETISGESVMMMAQSFFLEVAYKMRWWSQWGSPPFGLQFLSSLLKAPENCQTSHPDWCLACAPLDCSQHIATNFDKSRPECHQHHQQIQLEFQTFDLIASKFCPSCSLSFVIVINASNLTETRSGLMDSNLYLIVFFLDKKVKK